MAGKKEYWKTAKNGYKYYVYVKNCLKCGREFETKYKWFANIVGRNLEHGTNLEIIAGIAALIKK